MKIENLIAPYLFERKKLSLQELGTFQISQDVVIPTGDEKEFVLPDNAVTFEYNSRAAQDEEFIRYIMEQTRKIRPLATSDLESFTMLGKQFMNIGKPLLIDGLGMLIKNQQGQYEFKQGATFHNRLEAQSVPLKEKENKEIDFSAPPKKQGNMKWVAGLIIIVIAAVLGLVFYTMREKKDRVAEQPVVTNADSQSVSRDNVPTVPAANDSIQTAPVKTDSFSFKIVVREYTDLLTAEKKHAQFRTYGHKLVQVTLDSTHILLAMPFMNPVSDTARMRDSLKVLFGGNPYVRLQ